jgi:hypothetical protein
VMNTATGPQHLSDDALLAELTALCVAGRRNDARILVFLIQVEERRLYLLRACSSMYDFCRRKLGLSDGQACRRIAAARLVKRFPFILPLVARGEVHLCTLAQIRPFATGDNVHALIADTMGKTRDQVDRVLAHRFGLVRREWLSRGVLVIDEELEVLMQRGFELASHAVPDGDRLKLAKRAFRTFIEEEEKKRRAATERPRPGPAKPTKTIPRASTRAMFERHGEQCCYVDATTGERCPSRVYIQRDHRRMRVHGGTHDPENLQPMCGPHNRFLAALALGRTRIERAIRHRQQRRETDEDGPPA